jgi:nucleoside 2-deoxyribosyltransferase
MKVFLIAPVRGISPEQYQLQKGFVEILEKKFGHVVHWPHRDTDQDDSTGLRICRDNRRAIEESDLVYIIWDGKSSGCLFDLGIAFAMDKLIIPAPGLFPYPDLSKGKSFAAMVYALFNEQSYKDK